MYRLLALIWLLWCTCSVAVGQDAAGGNGQTGPASGAGTCVNVAGADPCGTNSVLVPTITGTCVNSGGDPCGTNTLQFVLPGFSPGGIDCYLAKSLYYGNCALTVSRASSATCNDATGNWYTVGNNLPCLTNLGLWVWEARTNGIRNNTMQGAIAGTPGTLPTNWSVLDSHAVTTNVIAFGVENGLNYIDVSVTGTPNATQAYRLGFETPTQIVASYGQTQTVSWFLRQSGGSTTNVGQFDAGFETYTGGGSLVYAYNNGSTNLVTIMNSYQRASFVATLNGSTEAFILPDLEMLLTSGQAINITFRIGWPQLELNPLINSSVASATVNAGGTLYTPSSSGTVTWSGAGCTTNPVLNVTTSVGGAINAVTSVATAGSCTTFPSSSATTWTDGTGLGTGSGASFNLVPTNNAAQGFATSPIPTSGSAVTRAVDVVTLTNVPAFGSQNSAVVFATPKTPTGNTSNRHDFLSISDGLNFNYSSTIYRDSGGAGDVGARFRAGGGANIFLTGAVWAQNTLGKAAATYTSSALNLVFNSVLTTNSTALSPTSLTVVGIGENGQTSEFCDCVISRFAINPNVALPAATLQTDTNLNLYNFLMERDFGPDNDNVPAWLRRRFG